MDKLESLKIFIGQYRSAVIAFSGGVDSTFLARITRDVMGKKVLLVTASSATYPPSELDGAQKLAEQFGMTHRVIHSDEINIPGFADNPPDRCYHCKRELFDQIKRIADQEGFEVVFDGSNTDDLHDYRPGRKALTELGIVSPLCESGLSKSDIRRFSRDLDLPTADKPAYACLASRFPYGEKITASKLDRVGRAEQGLRDMGFTLFRVRSHGTLARIECVESEANRAWSQRDEIERICKAAGFIYVAIDTQGYRTGAMNETL